MTDEIFPLVGDRNYELINAVRFHGLHRFLYNKNQASQMQFELEKNCSVTVIPLLYMLESCRHTNFM